MHGVEERRLRRITNTPQGEAIEGNTADDTLMVDQGEEPFLKNEVNQGSLWARKWWAVA